MRIPAKEHARNAKASLVQAGGRRISVNLEPAVAEAVDKLMLHHGVNQTVVIAHAVTAAAKKLP